MITTLDWIVLIVYFLFIAGVGFYVGLKVKDTSHYFLGQRKFGKWLMIGQSFGVGTHAEMPVSLAGAVYTLGFSGIWFQWKNLFATPFFWVFAPVFRRIRRTTVAELTEDRYGPWMGGIYIVFALIFFTINSAGMLKGAGKVISQAIGGQFDSNEIVVAMTVIFILYSFVGGLVAAAWTDFFQGLLIIVLSFMLIPLGFAAVGGMTGMKESLEAYKFSLAAPEGIGPWFIAMLTINGLIGIISQPHMLAAVGTGKDEYTCRVGFFYGNFVKRVCTVGWAFVGLLVAAMIAQGTFGIDKLNDAEDAFGFACRHLLFPGALGLLIASVLAANMSTGSAFMVNSGALFTESFYRRHVVRGRKDGHYLWVGRLSGFAITMMGVLYAIFLIDKVLYSFLLTETMATYMGISILGGIIWRRANRWGAVSSLVAAFATNFLIYRVRGERFDHWDPNVFLAALGAGVLALVVVSLLTKPESEREMESFFTRLDTPTELPGRTADPLVEGETSRIDREVVGREAAEAGQQSLLVNILAPMRATFGQGFAKTYRVDLKGFALGWLWSLLLVALTGLILKL
ncbi:MAG: sodium:solute symporter family protein [Acidobacteria bacterium]|nr:sodium:solute symporter family protein [Acidobacteriota bacterium]MCW5971449.1 sodium:solute symporter family protein [Blastocatellales bacterium]